MRDVAVTPFDLELLHPPQVRRGVHGAFRLLAGLRVQTEGGQHRRETGMKERMGRVCRDGFFQVRPRAQRVALAQAFHASRILFHALPILLQPAGSEEWRPGGGQAHTQLRA